MIDSFTTIKESEDLAMGLLFFVSRDNNNFLYDNKTLRRYVYENITKKIAGFIQI